MDLNFLYPLSSVSAQATRFEYKNKRVGGLLCQSLESVSLMERVQRQDIV